MRNKMSGLIKDPDLERLEIELNAPNIFNVLGIEQYEIRHSSFVAWLLDPKGSHNLNALFLNWFLKDIFSDEKIEWMDEFSLYDINLSNIAVKREWKNIDILLEHDDFVIVIENKVFSDEHSNQLTRYSEIVEEYLPKKYHAFVFLSPTSLVPKKEEDEKKYVVYSYEDIRKNIEILLNVNESSISDKAKLYMEDYLTVLRRTILKDHDSVKLAQDLYKRHQEVFDFIFENKPDRLMEVGEIIKGTMLDYGFELCSSSKGYVRFLTKSLSNILPNDGTELTGKECFVFEIDFWPKSVSFKTFITPGNEDTRKKLIEAIVSIPGSKKPKGEKWVSHFNDLKKIDVTSERYDSDEKIVMLIKELVDENMDLIKTIETKLISVFEEK